VQVDSFDLRYNYYAIICKQLLVVLVDDVDGVEAGREGCIMGMRDDMLTVGCQSRNRLHLVLARTWQVLPRELFRRLSAREGWN
jgi:hypothetical protein